MSFDSFNPYLHTATEKPIVSDAITLRNQILDHMLLNNKDNESKDLDTFLDFARLHDASFPSSDRSVSSPYRVLLNYSSALNKI